MTQAADIYGKSLYELARSEQAEERIVAEAEETAEIFRENPDYIRLLSEPSIHRQDRLRLLSEAFEGQIHPYLLNFLKILTEKEMLQEFGACCRVMRSLYNADHGIAEALVVSAVPLNDEQTAKLVSRLESLSGKKVYLKKKVDPKVLGGIRVEMDGRMLDGTVASRLNELRGRVERTII